MSTSHINAGRQRMQSALYDTEFAVELGKRILSAKIKNQSVVLRRYEKSRNIRLEEEQKMLSICRGKIENSRRIEEITAMKGKLRSSILEVFQSALRENFSLTEEVDAHQKMNLIQ